MRLLDTETGQFVEQDPERRDTVYAILSHTWDTENGEQTYTELKEIQRRYRPGSKDGISVVPDSKYDRFTPAPSQPPNVAPLFTIHPLPAVGCLTPSEVEVLFRAFGEAYGLTIPTSAPASSDSSASATECKVTKPPQSIWDDPELSPKIRDACAIAHKNGYRYIWIDSCCIDKSSSSELSEAINSMYKWYGLADVCYAYLADVPPGEDHQAEDSCFRKSRWFRRGWTLQELIAPINVEFLSADWTPIGSKHALHNLIESITGVSHKALLHVEPLSNFSVAQRLSWAAERWTTRVEDRAYSLLGIFDIHMPTLYGEGDRAFRRLQEQIMQRILDQSLFAWGDVYLPDPSQLLKNPNQIPIHNSITLEPVEYSYSWDLSLPAPSPQRFWRSANIHQVDLPASLYHEIGYTFTPYGIRTQFQMIPLTPDLLSRILPFSEVKLILPDDSNQWHLAILGCEHTERPGYLLGRVCYIPQSQSGVDLVYGGYIRFSPTEPDLFPLSPDTIEDFLPYLGLKTVYIPHPDPANQLLSLGGKSYNTIRLVLLTETRDALRSRGYHADLRDPDPDHPTTHWLTLSNDVHAITVDFQHTLEENGLALTINAEVRMPGSCVQPDSALGSDRADRRTVFWSDHLYGEWIRTSLGPETVRLSVAGAETLTVELNLDFVGMGFYYVRVDVRGDAPPAPVDIDFALPASSTIESAGGKAAREVTEVTGDDLPPGVVDTGGSEAGREVEVGKHGMASVDGARDLEVAGGGAEGEDHSGSV